MNMDIRKYYDSNNTVMAVVIPHDHESKGIEFCTKDEDYMQVACMGHKAGHVIIPHYHNRISRTVDYTCETLVVRKGAMRVTLYENKDPKYTFVLYSGDILTMFSGGHGFEVIEDIDMVEIKQGPYMGENDKTRF